jgi:hypothetical protein
VTFNAVHRIWGIVAIIPATKLVFPTLRECPPMITMAIEAL